MITVRFGHLPGFKASSFLPAALLAFCFGITLAVPTVVRAQADRPMRILLTNDDGIEKVKERVYPVAQKLRRFAEVYIVVPSQDRSGSTHFMRLSRKATLESRVRYISPAADGLHRLEIHTVDGYPADCVTLGIRGIMGGSPPDLVIAGPNGGPNLADDWYGSGTIGAARTAAYMGIPALAVSGIDDESEDHVDALSRWIAEMAQSDFILTLPEQTYITVAFPRVPPSLIAGVRVARRAHLISALSIDRVAEIGDNGENEETTSIWAIRFLNPTSPPATDSDVVLYKQNYIVITPMRADEHDVQFMDALTEDPDRLPSWPTQ
jgi:5'-nucleotidase